MKETLDKYNSNLQRPQLGAGFASPIWGRRNQIIGRFTTSAWFISFVTQGNQWIRDATLPGMSRGTF